MNNIIRSLIASLALISTAASATVYVEQGDTGYTIPTAQSVANNTTQIQGSLSPYDAVDVFKFNWKGGYFSANTFDTYNFDTMLFLFDKEGNKLAFNDDYWGLRSFINANLNSGTYLLGIDRYSLNYSGNLSGFAGSGYSYGPYNGNYMIYMNSAIDSTEVPEPGTLGLLGLATAGLAFVRRRKKA